MASKRILMITNEDDPFGNIVGLLQKDMIKTTVQRAKVTKLFFELFFINFW